MSDPRNQVGDHVTQVVTFARPRVPSKSHLHSEPTPMPTSTENSKRRIKDDTFGGSSRKKIKTSVFSSSSATSSLPATNGISEATSKTEASPAVLLGSIANPGTPSPQLHIAHGSPTINGSSVAPPTTPQSAGRPMVNTPNTLIKLSTSNVDPSCISPSQSSSRRSGGGPKAQESWQTQRASLSNDITKTPLPQVTKLLKHELSGSVCLHKGFFKEFLDINPVTQARVLQRACNQVDDPTSFLGHANYIGYDNTRGRWTLAEVITNQKSEKQVYQPLATALNVIGHAAFDIYRDTYPNDTIRKAYFPFVDHSARETQNDSPSDSAVMPDLLQGLAEEGRVHWGDTELIIECKSGCTAKLQNEAYLQLARYARNVFAHQIYRVGIFGFSLCGSIINFVYFDRSGMLYSPNIDLSHPENAHLFIQYLIALLTLDARRFGYDTRYSFDFASNPPRTLFKFGDDPPEPVNEIICHRKCICGRATCVTGLGDLVLKVIWRPEDRTDEGETLAGFKSVFGFCQIKAASCNVHSTKLKYADELEWSAATRYFFPESSATVPSIVSRGIRIQSNILMQRGTSLFEVQNPLHLVMAIHDALLGIMGLTEVGKLHCDISVYNLLLVDPKKHYPDQNWLGQPTFQVKPEVWEQTARGFSEAERHGGDSQSEYESPRLKRVKELYRGPYCVLHDTEFTVDAEPDRTDVLPDRTGTPTFISVELLLAKTPILRTFMHEIESLFWVLVWVLIHHTQGSNGSWVVNDHAKELIRGFSNNDIVALGKFKKLFIKNSCDIDSEEDILGLDNPWCADLVHLIQEFGTFLYCALYAAPSRGGFHEQAGNPLQGIFRHHDQYLDQTHQKTFDKLFGILERHMRILEKKYQVDLTKL